METNQSQNSKKKWAIGQEGQPTIYFYEDGNLIAVSGARNWRNNNPGNIEYGPFACKHGAIGSDGRFAIFPDRETGFNAMKERLTTGRYKGKTIEEAINIYAPRTENDTERYINHITKWTGIDRTRKINELTEEEMDKLVNAMAREEGNPEEAVRQPPFCHCKHPMVA